MAHKQQWESKTERKRVPPPGGKHPDRKKEANKRAARKRSRKDWE